MSKRQDIDRRVHALTEITEILGAMKTLALLETQKLTRHLAAQRRVVHGIEAAATDFAAHYPDAIGPISPGQPVLVLMGSERGFCGDYNRALVAAVEQDVSAAPVNAPLFVTVGHKLSARLEKDARVAAAIPGPNVSEEVQPALVRLMDVLRELQAGRAPGRLLDIHVWHHLPTDGGTQVTSRRPLLPTRVLSDQVSYPPELYLEPARFAAGLVDEYLFAVLHEIFYDSLMAENQRRFQQMDQAVNRLERDLADLRGQRNILRQEEITEEIEVIMLSAEALGQPLKPR